MLEFQRLSPSANFLSGRRNSRRRQCFSNSLSGLSGYITLWLEATSEVLLPQKYGSRTELEIFLPTVNGVVWDDSRVDSTRVKCQNSVVDFCIKDGRRNDNLRESDGCWHHESLYHRKKHIDFFCWWWWRDSMRKINLSLLNRTICC